ncbi:hypothetical protein [Stenotrophomonas daejeonensis]|uniref:hypothetical protein n=1 Tax=Stenotrophomonas daejeonensis TaxID=659018 RepID=UPI00128FC4A9|nr:hypothetical protein [Stenotrophomonas daejeonensis]
MSQSVGKVEAASLQLDWAIRLLIDFDAPLPAITLAGAAEEILGRALGDDSAHEDLIRAFSESHGIDRKVLSQQHLNKARNWLKHWDPKTEPEFETFDLLQEAIQGIARGLSNMAIHTRSISAEGHRFHEWASLLKQPAGP